jgi:hypothetical protein
MSGDLTSALPQQHQPATPPQTGCDTLLIVTRYFVLAENAFLRLWFWKLLHCRT